MAKKPLPRITEPDKGLVHFEPPLGADAVTLCGLTDFIGVTSGEPTNEPVNCNLCRWIVEHIHKHAKPNKSDFAF